MFKGARHSNWRVGHVELPRHPDVALCALPTGEHGAGGHRSHWTRWSVDIDFTFSLSTAPGLSLPVRGQSEEIVSMTTALRDDLGLTLEEEHGPVEVLVIEAARFRDPD